MSNKPPKGLNIKTLRRRRFCDIRVVLFYRKQVTEVYPLPLPHELHPLPLPHELHPLPLPHDILNPDEPLVHPT